MSGSGISVPAPPAFLDPLVSVDNSYYYTVPPGFFGFHHPNTRWLISMIKANEQDRVRRKLDLNPELFKGRYFQLVDYPRLYLPNDATLSPMFKRQSVLYLSVLGISLYLRNVPLVDVILLQRDSCGLLVCDVNEPQFASHVQDLAYGDFHAFPPCIIMLRMCCFEVTVSLQQAGWNPALPLALPMRRKFERRVLYFYDWLEAGLCLISERPMYPLQSLVVNMIRNLSVYKPVQLPIEYLVPPTPQQRVPSGLIDVEELPKGTQMIGVRSLLELAEDYYRFIQMRSCVKEVAALKKEALAAGLNPEILMIQVQDFDGNVASNNEASASNADRTMGNVNSSNAAAAGATSNSNDWWHRSDLGQPQLLDRLWAIEPDSRQQRLLTVNANNSASSAARNERQVEMGVPRQLNVSASSKKKPLMYASEGVRVLHFALEKDKTSKRMQVCLDAIIVLTKRNFFVNGQRLQPEKPRARDQRNMVVLLLNMIQREQEKSDVIVAKIQSGFKKFQHLEEHKMLDNRRQASVINMSKMTNVLTRILLQSKELVQFIQSSFPPFAPSSVDFKLNPKLQTKYKNIMAGVVQEFNIMEDSWTFLTQEMLLEVMNIKLMQLHMRVGKQPSAEEILQARKIARKTAVSNKSNMSNTNSCFVTFRKVQSRARGQKPKRKVGVKSTTTDNNASMDSTSFSQPDTTADICVDSNSRWWSSPLQLSGATASTVAATTVECGTEYSPTSAVNTDCNVQLFDGSLVFDRSNNQHLLGDDRISREDAQDTAQLLDDLAASCSESLFETELLMSSLEVHHLLSSQGDFDLAATQISHSNHNNGLFSDTVTIEPNHAAYPCFGDMPSGSTHSCNSSSARG